MAHRHYQPEQWPQYEMQLSSTDSGSILHFSIDLLIADFASIQILLAELGELYEHPERELKPLRISYRDLILARKDTENSKAAARYEKHKAYWLERIQQMPMPPELPLAIHNKKQESVTFSRQNFSLDSQLWQALKQKANAYQITPSSIVLSAFTEVLGRWSRNREFCINLTMLNRSTAHPDIRGVVGDFIEVNVLGVCTDPDLGFFERTQQLQQQLWLDLEHTAFTGIEVLREMSQQQQSNVIVPIVYTSTVGLSGDDLDANEFMHDAKLRYGITQTPQVWLDCQVTERNGVLIVDWDIRSGIFQQGVIEQAHAAFCRLLEQLAGEESIWSSISPIALPATMLQVREQVNATGALLSQDHLHTGFCQQALSQPQAMAILSHERNLSYGELASQAIACKLQLSELIQSGDRVAIVMDKSVDQISAVLGVLLADATYVPIEASQPVARRNRILSDAGIKVVITSKEHLEAEWPVGISLIIAQQQRLKTTYVTQELEKSLLMQVSANTAEKAAYIIYTSGTTGQPKGVEMSHQAAVNTLSDINQRFDLGPLDRVLALVSFGFDLSIWDIFGTLRAGATLVLPALLKHYNTEPSQPIMRSFSIAPIIDYCKQHCPNVSPHNLVCALLAKANYSLSKQLQRPLKKHRVSFRVIVDILNAPQRKKLLGNYIAYLPVTIDGRQSLKQIADSINERLLQARLVRADVSMYKLLGFALGSGMANKSNDPVSYIVANIDNLSLNLNPEMLVGACLSQFKATANAVVLDAGGAQLNNRPTVCFSLSSDHLLLVSFFNTVSKSDIQHQWLDRIEQEIQGIKTSVGVISTYKPDYA
ncbi:AMP-binding protein [Psychromonas hadalis]|uniref:AMP-binding protein n=1 Tax=Psychromonas hadalis TaxID=211669 RepID=UPI000416BB53|nr:AMP-binding protein [Psychromonas hadalis]